MNEEPDELTRSHSTAPESIPVTVHGGLNDQEATEFAHLVANTVRAIGTVIDVDQLDGITVSTDYESALEELDRGDLTNRVLRRTNDGGRLGVAMAPAVSRDGVVKTHLVFDYQAIMGLSALEGDEFNLAMYLIAHECAHIEYHKVFMPSALIDASAAEGESLEDEVIASITTPILEEYWVCRRSAPFGSHADATSMHEESCMTVIPGATESARRSIREYRTHGCTTRVLDEVGKAIFEPILTTAYLLGDLAAQGKSLADVPTVKQALYAEGYTDFIEEMIVYLDRHYSCQDSRRRSSVERQLSDAVHEAFASRGLILSTLDTGELWVDVPFTEDTMP